MEQQITIDQITPGMMIESSSASGRHMVLDLGYSYTYSDYMVYIDPFYTYFPLSTIRKIFPPEAPPSRDKYISSPINRRYCYRMGMDPEVFVTSSEGEILDATKYLLKETGRLPAEGAAYVYYDGFQAEMCTRPTHCICWMVDGIHHGLYQILAKYPAGSKFSSQDMIEIPYTTRMEASPEAVTFGCSPSSNVYNHPPIMIPDARLHPWRSVGSHMHFGFPSSGVDSTSKHITFPPSMIDSAIRALDAITGCIMTSLLEGLEGQTSPVRRTMYGRAGEYRLKPYGFEWRTPGIGVILHPAVTHLIWDISRIVCDLGLRGLGWLWDATEAETLKIVNEYDVTLAREVLGRNEKMIVNILTNIYWSSPNIDKTFKIITNGIQRYTNITDMYRNWLSFPWGSHCESAGCTWTSFLTTIR